MEMQAFFMIPVINFQHVDTSSSHDFVATTRTCSNHNSFKLESQNSTSLPIMAQSRNRKIIKPIRFGLRTLKKNVTPKNFEALELSGGLNRQCNARK